MLAPMDLDLATLRSFAAVAGFDFSDAELEALRPALDRALAQLRHLEALPVAALDPAVQYRML